MPWPVESGKKVTVHSRDEIGELAESSTK